MTSDMDGTETGLLANFDCDDDDIAHEPDADRVLQILDETAGGWADLDVDTIIAEIYEARRDGSRPPDRS